MLLQTDRLTVRPVEASDWEAMQAIWLDFSKSPYACFDCPHSTEEADVRPRIARWARAAQTGPDHLSFSVCLEAQVIGYISANIRPDGYELGYCFRSDFQGKGYALESLLTVMDYLKGLGVSKLTVGTALENTPSVAFLSRLGFQLTATEQISFYKDQKGQAIVSGAEFSKRDFKRRRRECYENIS